MCLHAIMMILEPKVFIVTNIKKNQAELNKSIIWRKLKCMVLERGSITC